MMNYLDLYRKCMQIRLFERKVETEFSNGTLRGTTHGCIGQEIIPVLVMENIDHQNDYVTGTHRCHGQVLAYTGDVYSLACEMMGKSDGYVCGMGGSQHIKVGNYITNGITGGMLTIAAGMAMALKKDEGTGIVVSFVGDGGFNEGYLQESLNLAAHFEVPLLIVCENNKYAMSTPTVNFSAGTFKDRVKAYGINYIESSSAVPSGLFDDIRNGFSYVRSMRKPCFIDIHTARLCGHSKSDPREYMSLEEKGRDEKNDPILWLEKNIEDFDKEKIIKELIEEIDTAFLKARNCDEITLEKWRVL